MKRYIFLIIIFLLGLAFLIYVHEETHKVINYYFTGETGELKFFCSDGAISAPICIEGYCDNDSCNLAHSINEIVGYNLIIIYIILMLIILVGCE